jgi:small basic protein
MVIFHSYVNVYQRVTITIIGNIIENPWQEDMTPEASVAVLGALATVTTVSGIRARHVRRPGDVWSWW